MRIEDIGDSDDLLTFLAEFEGDRSPRAAHTLLFELVRVAQQIKSFEQEDERH